MVVIAVMVIVALVGPSRISSGVGCGCSSRGGDIST